MQILATTTGPGFGLVLVVVAAVLLVAWVLKERHRRRLQAALARFVDRHEGWHRQAWPCGVQPQLLVGRFASMPRGDRRYGVEHAVGGPLELEVDGRPTTCQVACFQWFHEQRRRSRNGRGATSTTYERRRELVVLCQLPLHTHRSVSIGPESILGRIGLTRGGEQLESDAFNRRFRVEGRDRELVVRLLDAQLQELLVTAYTGRSIEFSDDLLALAGQPSHQDPSLTGVVRAYPAIVQDLTRLVRGIPHSFWRAMRPSDQDAMPPHDPSDNWPGTPDHAPPHARPDTPPGPLPGPPGHTPWER